MRARVYCGVAVLACLMMPPAVVAQQGHPLAGIWSGDWGPTATERSPVLIDMSWETTTLSGFINPGFPDAATIEVGILDSTNWTVHLEANARDEAGNTVRVVLDGKLEDIGSPHRTLTGTWSRGDTRGDFKVTRE